MTIFKDAFEKAGFSQKHFEARTIITNLMKGGLSASELIEIVHEVEETLSEGHPWRASNGQTAFADAQPPMPDEGHFRCAREGLATSADVRPPMPEGQVSGVRKDHTYSADGQPIASGEAISDVPGKAKGTVPPARDPVSPMPGEGLQDAVQQDHPQCADARQSNPEPGGQGTGDVSDIQTGIAPKAQDLSVKRGGGFASINRSIIHNQAPSPERMRAVREAGHTSVPTVFERFKCPDQITPIGSVRAPDLEGWANSSLRFASLFRRIGALAVARGKLGPSYTVRDILTAKELERVIIDSGVVMDGKLTKGVLLQADGTLLAISGSAA